MAGEGERGVAFQPPRKLRGLSIPSPPVPLRTGLGRALLALRFHCRPLRLARAHAPTPPATSGLAELHTLLAAEDYLSAAPKALAWVQSASVNDLRAFIKDPTPLPFEAHPLGFAADPRRRPRCRHGPLAHSRARRTSPPRFHQPALQALAAAAARTNPELVVAEYLAKQARSPFAKAERSAFENFAARALPGKISDATERSACAFAMVRGLAQTDIFAAIRALPADDPGQEHGRGRFC